MTQHTCDWTTPDAREWLREILESLWMEDVNEWRVHDSTDPINFRHHDHAIYHMSCEGDLLTGSAGEIFLAASSIEALPQLLARLDELEEHDAINLKIKSNLCEQQKVLGERIAAQIQTIAQQAAEIERLNTMLADISKAIGEDIEESNKRHQKDIAQDVICDDCRERRVDTGALKATRCPGCQRGWCAKVYELPKIERKPKMIRKTSGPLTIDDEPGTGD